MVTKAVDLLAELVVPLNVMFQLNTNKGSTLRV